MSSKNVKQIKIMVSTNISETPFELTFSKIYNPAPGETPRRIRISQYPFFTADIEYPEKLLASKSYTEILNIFFDKQEFVRVIINNEQPTLVSDTREVSPERQFENANKNTMIMLKLLFPTSYPTKNNLNTSYNKYLLKKGPTLSFDVSDVSSMFSSGEITALGKRNYSYLTTEKGICTITEVIWLNDLLNNKLYRELIEKLIEYTEWVKTQSTVIKKDIKNVSLQLLSGLNPTGTGDLLITAKEQTELINQKRIYNPDDIKKDIIDIIEKNIVIDSDINKTKRFNEELGYMIDDFIDTHIKNNKTTPITQIVRFKDKFNFTYKTKNGNSDLFTLHKRYDGSDKATQIITFTTEKTAKETELNKLENGYIETRNWVFGKKQIDQYVQNLNNLITIAASKPVFRGKKTPPTITEIGNVLKKDIIPPSEDYDTITIVPGINYNKISIINFNRVASANNSGFIEDVKSRISDISPDIVKSFNVDINNINRKITELTLAITELRKPNEEIFTFEGESDVPKEPIDQLKKDNAQRITKMQEEIFKSVITRYNRFQDIKRSAELSGQYTEIDSSIDIIVDEIKKLEALVLTTTPTADEILSITEPIKNSFDKLVVANKISISRKIGAKLTQIIKLSNQIKFLNQLETVFFKDPATGIFVDYEKTLDKADSFTQLLLTELKQEKYSNFPKMVSFIKNKFLKSDIISLNPALAKIISEYFENRSNHFYETVIEPANLLLNSGKSPDFSGSGIWNISVISVKSGDGEREYEISVYMDVIEGELNAKNQSEIKCQFLDEELTRRFEELMDEGATYGPSKNTKVFSIKKAKDERIKHEEELKQELESAKYSRNKAEEIRGNSRERSPSEFTLESNKKPIPSAPPLSEGGRRNTKSYRSMMNNRTKKNSCKLRNTRKL